MPAGPTRLAEMSTSAPAPGAEVEDGLALVQSATAVGSPQPREAASAASGICPSSCGHRAQPPKTSLPRGGRALAAARRSPAPQSALRRAALRRRSARGPARARRRASSSLAAGRAAAAARRGGSQQLGLLARARSRWPAARGAQQAEVDRRCFSSAMRIAPSGRRGSRSSRPTGPGARSRRSRPSRSFLRWWESVGWEMSNSGTSSQTQTLPACLRSTSTSCRRIGSPSALATSAMRSACSRCDVGVDDRLAAAARRQGAWSWGSAPDRRHQSTYTY